jgi:cyclohexa-1,5-dienecarbonyl-CoA hydratase
MCNIKIEKYEFLARIIFSKPPLNIFNTQDLIDIENILQDLRNQKDLKLIVFESDQKVFSAGVDIEEHLPEKAEAMFMAFHKLFSTLMDLEIPTLSLVKSGCFGGGSELALFCDFTLASTNAFFAHPEIKLGCFPPLSMAHLSYITSRKKALEMILTGEKISAQEALQAGLVNHVFSEEEFDEKTGEFTNSILYNSAAVISATLKAYKKINCQDLKEKLQLADKIFKEEIITLSDYTEGANSFMQKRLPEWHNF